MLAQPSPSKEAAWVLLQASIKVSELRGQKRRGDRIWGNSVCNSERCKRTRMGGRSERECKIPDGWIKPVNISCSQKASRSFSLSHLTDIVSLRSPERAAGGISKPVNYSLLPWIVLTHWFPTLWSSAQGASLLLVPAGLRSSWTHLNHREGTNQWSLLLILGLSDTK